MAEEQELELFPEPLPLIEPPEPYPLISSVDIGAGPEVGSVSGASYAIEYNSTGDRAEIRNLLADTFQINNNFNDQPSPGPSYPVPLEVTDSEFFSIDARPVIASDVEQERSDTFDGIKTVYGSTINSYTSFLSRPDLWRTTNGGMFEVAGIGDLKHYSYLPADEERTSEDNWPGTEVGVATGILSKDAPTKITNIVVSYFNGSYTQVREGDLLHDEDKLATATNGYIPRNTRVKNKDNDDDSIYTLNKSHTYTGEVGIAHTFTIRRIGPSKVDREYGYYGYHYINENQYTSERSFSFYYGRIPNGEGKVGTSELGAAGVDGNTDRYSSYNTGGRWGVYIDSEVSNYMEGRLLIGHNRGIGVGAGTSTINNIPNTISQPDPILSVFNNRFKFQQDYHGDYNFDLYQMGLYVEDFASIGIRPDVRYRLSVDGTSTGAGILGKFDSTKAAYFKGDVDVDGNIVCTGIVTAVAFDGEVKVSTASSNINFKIPFADTSASVTDTYRLLQDSQATFTYNPNTNTLSCGSINAGSLSVTGVKNFDIPHPSKDGWRLRYVCLEGPTADVYIRGKLEGSNIIELPDYWYELVDQETIMVNLTPFGVYQELFVEKIEWGRKIIIKNNMGGPINCSYVVYAERKDVDKNESEYRA